MTVDKTREKYQSGKFEVDIDKVADLGTFVEIEAIGRSDDKEGTLKKLIKFARSLGLDPNKEDNNGYVLLLLKKKGLVRV